MPVVLGVSARCHLQSNSGEGVRALHPAVTDLWGPQTAAGCVLTVDSSLFPREGHSRSQNVLYNFIYVHIHIYMEESEL